MTIDRAMAADDISGSESPLSDDESVVLPHPPEASPTEWEVALGGDTQYGLSKAGAPLGITPPEY
ncbi:MAG TPA: hypothetical protein VF929_11345 [Gemmatimonadaceae bacterium]